MKTRTHLAVIAGAALALALAPSAGAAAPDSGLYLNAEGGVNWATAGGDDLDLGYRIGAGIGYNINKNWGVEFDTGWLWNDIKDVDGSLSHIPAIINGVFRYPLNAKWEAYAGAGVGGAYSMLDIDDSGVDDSDEDIVFAWQLFAGVRYNIKENMSLGVGYKYLGTSEGDYDIGGGSLSVDDVHNHSFSLVFNLKF